MNIGYGAQDTLISVDTRKHHALFARLDKVAIEILVRGPHATHSTLSAEDIVCGDCGFERSVQIVNVGTLKENPALAIRQLATEIDAPTVASLISSSPVEPSQNCRRHLSHLSLVRDPVQPYNLNPFATAAIDDLQDRPNGSETCCVLAILGIDEIILHVDNDNACLASIDLDSLISGIRLIVG
jgi:hypothetical protein